MPRNNRGHGPGRIVEKPKDFKNAIKRLLKELTNQKNSIKKLCDDVRYMSPVDTDLASKLEMKLIISSNVLTESTLSALELDSKILELKNLINQRKLLKK